MQRCGWIAAVQMDGYGGLQSCRSVAMWLCGYPARRWTGMEHVALWFPTVQTLCR